MKTIDYTIVEDNYMPTLIDKIKEHLSLGWQPLDGPFTIGDVAYQAMVMEEPK